MKNDSQLALFVQHQGHKFAMNLGTDEEAIHRALGKVPYVNFPHRICPGKNI